MTAIILKESNYQLDCVSALLTFVNINLNTVFEIVLLLFALAGMRGGWWVLQSVCCKYICFYIISDQKIFKDNAIYDREKIT